MNNQQLSNQINYGVILFKDKSKISITKQEWEFLKNLNSEIFKFRGNIYSFNMIAKILTIDEYYNEYPDQRSQQTKIFNSYDFEKDNKDKSSGYQKLYSSKEYCEQAIKTFTRIIEERKAKGESYAGTQALLDYAKRKFAGLDFKKA